MSTTLEAASGCPAPGNFPDSAERIAGWNVLRFPQVDSTNAIARTLDPWSAVVAGIQTGGRGQYDRTFVSDLGGMFLSVVIPAEDPARRWVGFPLAVGWALLAVLNRWSVAGARLRWPNDLMAGNRKLGGILVEQSGPDTLVVGVGINLSNRPWMQDPHLWETATRVADCAPVVPRMDQALHDILRALRIAHHEMKLGGLAGLQTRINDCWGDAHEVEVDLGDDHPCTGRFGGIDPRGNLLVWTRGGAVRSFAHQHVRRMREMPGPGGNMFSSRP